MRKKNWHAHSKQVQHKRPHCATLLKNAASGVFNYTFHDMKRAAAKYIYIYI